MAAPAPTAIYEHAMTPVKGFFEITGLNYSTKMAPAVTIIAHAGRVVSLNSAGEFEMGISGTKMGMILSVGSNSFQVANPGVTETGLFMHRAGFPDGTMNALVASGGYELGSSEFDKTPAIPYAPNQLLTAVTASNSNQAVSGVLSNDRNGAGGSAGLVRPYTDAACGVVSQGQMLNEWRVPTIYFWTVYLPASA